MMFFDEAHARQYGQEEAVMIQHFLFWIRENKTKGINQVKGRTWTYNTLEAYQKIYPFWTVKQIRRILTSLIKQGFLIKSRHARNRYDRTSWYAMADEADMLQKEEKRLTQRQERRGQQQPKTAGTPREAPAALSTLPNLPHDFEPPQALTGEVVPAAVAVEYDQVFKPHGLTADHGDALFYSYLQLLLKERPQLTLKDFTRVFLQAKAEFMPKLMKRGFCKWKLLLRNEMFFELLTNALIREEPARPQRPFVHQLPPPSKKTVEDVERANQAREKFFARVKPIFGKDPPPLPQASKSHPEQKS